jgi:hypothetical protein
MAWSDLVDIMGSFPGGGWGMGAAGLGLGADATAYVRNLQEQQRLRNLYNKLYNPTKLAEGAAQLMPQMSPAAIAQFNRGVDADFATRSGGAQGGATVKNSQDAWAARTSADWFKALDVYRESLGGARGTVTQPQQPLGGLMNIMQLLFKLKGSQQTPTPSGIATPPGAAGPSLNFDPTLNTSGLYGAQPAEDPMRTFGFPGGVE